ncbi:hypothetical protein Tco_1509431 [Tanacetum coccineum]
MPYHLAILHMAWVREGSKEQAVQGRGDSFEQERFDAFESIVLIPLPSSSSTLRSRANDTLATIYLAIEPQRYQAEKAGQPLPYVPIASAARAPAPSSVGEASSWGKGNKEHASSWPEHALKTEPSLVHPSPSTRLQWIKSSLGQLVKIESFVCVLMRSINETLFVIAEPLSPLVFDNSCQAAVSSFGTLALVPVRTQLTQAQSPDGCTLQLLQVDETLRFWNVFGILEVAAKAAPEPFAHLNCIH